MTILLDILKEHLNFKQQIGKLAIVDLIKTYRGAALGWLWAVIKPSITILVYWFAFEIGLKIAQPVNGFPYWIWLVVGIIPWFYMSTMLAEGSRCMNKYSYLLTKMKFPISIIPTFVSVSKLIEHLMVLATITYVYVCCGYPIDIYFIQLPLYIGFMYLFFTFWSLFASPLGAINKDFVNLVRSFITPLFWLSGIIWDPNTIAIPWIKAILKFNPVTYICNGFRNVFVYKRWFFEDAHTTKYFLIMLVIMFILALFSYRKFRKNLADSL